jgi:hypothetical protein
MNKKSILLIILCALILSPFIFAIGDGNNVTSYEQAFQDYTAKVKQSNETNYIMRPKELLTVKQFIKKAELFRIRRIEVYYSSWSSGFYGGYGYSEEGLRNEFDSKSIINNPYPQVLSTIKLELEKFTLDPDPAHLDPAHIRFPDYRLGFVAQDNSGRVLTISFVYNAPLMSVNGIQYIASPELVASVINFLPHTSYDLIYKELVYSWYGRGLSYIQKNEPDKSN